jgi:hypothetical protein
VGKKTKAAIKAVTAATKGWGLQYNPGDMFETMWDQVMGPTFKPGSKKKDKPKKKK